jgi:ribosomal protein S18 acetylase RimI-like enzyme
MGLMAVLATTLTSTTTGLRPLDERRDLSAVADLIEMCFSENMDPEGRRYIRELRLNARTAGFWQIMGAFAEPGQNPYYGYVWEECERVVGNVSLFPFQIQGHRCYLIANVAVHPDYRGRGIGRALTSAGINFSRSRNAQAAWLHVRDDNGPAVHIYQSLGFLERARRTTWQVRGTTEQRQVNRDGLAIHSRSGALWPLQREWLRRLYPRELSWHLPLDWKAFEPGLFGSLYRFMNFTFPRHWAIQRNSDLLGVLTWQRSLGSTDNLWLATPEKIDDIAIRELLACVRRYFSTQRTARLNLPASHASEALLEAGYEVGHTLIWMEYRLGL